MSDKKQPEWVGLFPDRDFRFSFGARAGDAARFFGPTDEHEELLAERRRWIAETPEVCLLSEPAADAMIEEACELALEWGTTGERPDGLEGLGEAWEADFVLLDENDEGRFVMRAGVVCFPSAWSPETKMGLPVHEIHAPVPTLNRDLGERIDKFLAAIKPGAAWERNNWGLSRSPERNQHPARDIPRLVPPFTAEESWVRSEDQILVRLPKTNGLLFGIRIVNVSLAEINEYPAAAAGLHRAIATMPEDVAEYKNVTQAREHLLSILRN